MPFAPVCVTALRVRLVEPSTERRPLPDSVIGEETLALRRRSVPLWMSIDAAAALVNELMIVVVPLVPCLRSVPLFVVVCAAVQPQWLYQRLSPWTTSVPPVWMSTSELL